MYDKNNGHMFAVKNCHSLFLTYVSTALVDWLALLLFYIHLAAVTVAGNRDRQFVLMKF